MTSNYHQAIIGNGRTCALVEPDATISFCCMPDFDSGTVMASLLDSEKGGSFGIEQEGGEVVAQSYDGATNILITRFSGPEGAFEVIDFMPRYHMIRKENSYEDVGPDVVRLLKPVEGSPRVIVRYRPALDYARFPTSTVEDNEGRLKSTTSGVCPDGRKIYESLYLYSDIENEDLLEENAFTLDQSKFLLMSYHDKVTEPSLPTLEVMHQRTRAYWLVWSAATARPIQYEQEVMRSALVLKMLQYSPSGAFVAAATTSLPETIGEERNWDYRFCWIRDASMTVSTLNSLGHPRMASRFVDWVLNTVRSKDDSLQIMYGLRGEKELTEETLDHFSGYRGSRPVRIGNAAYDQSQHDIYGILLDVIWQDIQERKRTPEALERRWTHVRSIVRTVVENWKDPDQGIWEIRGEKRHFVFSKVLCWVAIDRAIKIAAKLGKLKWVSEKIPLRDEIHQTICREGWSEEKQAFTQSYETDDLDASSLLMAEFGFIDGRDPRFVSTVKASMEELCHNGLMYRYRNKDDFGEPSSAFTVCSFWMVKALVATGEKERARIMFEELLGAANPHGLYGEDLDFVSRRHLGNFPQAYSHLALIDCAMMLEDDDIVGSVEGNPNC